jgi:hypothetical protein
MAATALFTIGAGASCSGEVNRAVTGPVTRTVTHLVAGPKHRRGLRLLVPLSPASAAPGEIRLRCTTRDSGKPVSAGETQFVPASSGYEACGREQPCRAGHRRERTWCGTCVGAGSRHLRKPSGSLQCYG